jgi:hypothetical protein
MRAKVALLIYLPSMRAPATLDPEPPRATVSHTAVAVPFVRTGGGNWQLVHLRTANVTAAITRGWNGR